MEMLSLVKIMKLTRMLLNSSKVRLNRHLMLSSSMTRTGSPMKISTYSFMTHILNKNFQERILRLELLLLMMISQVKFALKTRRVLRFPQPNQLVILLFLERMEVMVSSRSTTQLFHLVIVTILQLME